jgi:tripartite-type tricarboxylate transporter receptor subunit TctC
VLRQNGELANGCNVGIGLLPSRRNIVMHVSKLFAVPAILAVLGAGAAAQSPAEFYKGKTIDMMIGYSVGGGYDVYARVVARHMGRHIPGNPLITPRNMEGAGSLRLANWLYNVGKKDGTVIGTIGRGTGFDPLFGHKSAQFDGNKFNWIGSANDEVSVCVVWNGRTKITKFDDLLTTPLTVGGTGAAADTDQFPRIINGVLGTQMKIITGYPGGNDVNLAMERGEVDGRCGWSWSSLMSTRPNWIKEKKITVLVQLSLEKHPDLPDVPLITDLAKTEEQRQILRLIFARQALGRPYLAPPGVPDDRVAALRKAFMDTMKDKEFLAEADKAQLEITPIAGEELQKLVGEVYETPPAVVRKAADILKQ